MSNSAFSTLNDEGRGVRVILTGEVGGEILPELVVGVHTPDFRGHGLSLEDAKRLHAYLGEWLSRWDEAA